MKTASRMFFFVLLFAIPTFFYSCSCKKKKKGGNIHFLEEFPVKSLPGVKGGDLTLEDMKDGRVHLLMFFTSHCVECVDKIFNFRDLGDRMPSDKFAFHLVYFPQEVEDPMQAAKRESDSLPVDLQVVVDRDRKLAPQLLIKDQFPMVVIFDGQARLASPPMTDITRKIGNLFTFDELLSKIANGEVDEDFWYKVVQTPSCFLVGQPIPDLKFPDASGKPISIRDFVGRKSLVLMYWGSDCPHCRKELPLLNNFYLSRMDNLNFGVLSVVVAPPRVFETRVRETLQFAQEQRLAFPVLFDIQGVSFEKLLVKSYPTMLFIDADGYIRDCRVGELDNFSKEMEQILGKIK